MNSDIKLKILSSLEKIYHSDNLPSKEIQSFSMLKNERKSIQLAIESEKDFDCEIEVNSPLEYNLYLVEHIKSDLAMSNNSDNYYRFSEDGYYPDLLSEINQTVHINKGITVFWVEIMANNNAIGNNIIEFSIKEDGNCVTQKSIMVEVINCNLNFKDFIYTNWFHTDCLSSYYNVEVFSDEYWRITENFLKTASEHGMNCVLTPLFTPPLDTEFGKERPTVQLVDVSSSNGKYIFNFEKLTQWIQMAHRCGITYFEMSHFYTQWGARHAPKIMATVNGEYRKIFGWETKASSKEYKNFLKQFSLALKKYLEDNNLNNNIFIHVSDEPNFSMIIPYSKASKYIHKLFKGYKIIDALSDPWFYKLGIVSSPIPANDHIEKFINKCTDLWTYYCSAQTKKYVSNRFFCNDSIRNRVLGYQLYKYDIKGFLHWGYNFYYTQLSKQLIDPYTVSDAGGKFPSGDSYVVYPGKDGRAKPSIRLKVFYDALQDMAALNALEHLTDKKTCLDIIEENGSHSLTFSNYPHSDEWLLKTRENINQAIKENI